MYVHVREGACFLSYHNLICLKGMRAPVWKLCQREQTACPLRTAIMELCIHNHCNTSTEISAFFPPTFLFPIYMLCTSLPCLRPSFFLSSFLFFFFFLIFSLKGSCRSTPCSLRPEWEAREYRESQGGGMSPWEQRLESEWECRKAGYHGALWLGDFTAVPWERLQNAHKQREKAVCWEPKTLPC